LSASVRIPPPSDALWASLAETTNDLLWSIDLEGRWAYLNPAAARRIFGCEATEMTGRPMQASAVESLRERDAVVMGRVLAGQSVFRHETRHVRRDGTVVDLSFNAVPLRDRAGAVLGATGTARDITDERAASAALQESVEKLRLAVEAAELAYWEWEPATGLVHWGSDPTGRLAGDDARSMSWDDYSARVHPDDRARYRDDARRAWEDKRPYASEYRVIGRDGVVAWISARGKVLTDAARVREGDRITTRLSRGALESEVKRKPR